jgi:ABC-2 type transport system permease protein
MQSRMQYRADFITGIISILILNAVSLGLISILVGRFVHLNGWGIWELVFLYSLWMLGHSIYSLLFWHFNTMEEYIVQGTFDHFLLRPFSPLVQFLGREIQYMGVGDILVGVAGISLSFTKLGLHWGLAQWAFFVIAVLSGTIIEMALAWIIACLSFWTGRSLTASFIVMRLNLLVQQYPVDIFGTWFRVIVTGLIPVAFINYYPSLMLLGKEGKLEQGAYLTYASPFVAIALILIASFIWKMALSRYTSSGS